MIINSDVLKAQLCAAFRMMEVTAEAPEVERPNVVIHFGDMPQEARWEYDFALNLRDKFKCPFRVTSADVAENSFIVLKLVSWLRASLEPLDKFTPTPHNGVITLTPQGDGFVASISVNYYSEF